MHGPPDPEMRSPAIRQDDRAKSQKIKSEIESDTGVLDFQARELRRLFFFCQATARTIATLAYGVVR